VTRSVCASVRAAQVADTVTDLLADTRLVTMVKAALVAPAGTVTLAGTRATLGSDDFKATTAPPAGAAALS
jgi:hypothetical protein